jgi:predicted acetyltransferase
LTASSEPSAADTIASAKTIEYHGGVLDGIRDTEVGPARRYWIKP